MHTAVGLRFLRTLAQLGDATPDYLEPTEVSCQPGNAEERPT
ncbi:MAG TPA: hypothetical protein VM307_05750 [Egibacteraceae bacterium]|nr:hypothetical protein [Egibacteraceae bacterium]